MSIATENQLATSLPPTAVPRRIVFLHSLAFVFGFGVVFTLLGSAAGLLGRSLFDYQIIVQKVGGVMLILFGLTTLGLFFKLSEWLESGSSAPPSGVTAVAIKICYFFNALLYTERHVKEMHDINPNWGYMSSFAVGVSFSAGWVPCIGPISGQHLTPRQQQRHRHPRSDLTRHLQPRPRAPLLTHRTPF